MSTSSLNLDHISLQLVWQGLQLTPPPPPNKNSRHFSSNADTSHIFTKYGAERVANSRRPQQEQLAA